MSSLMRQVFIASKWYPHINYQCLLCSTCSINTFSIKLNYSRLKSTSVWNWQAAVFLPHLCSCSFYRHVPLFNHITRFPPLAVRLYRSKMTKTKGEMVQRENQQFCSIIAHCFPDSIQTNSPNHKCICDPHFARAALILVTGIELQKWVSRSLGALNFLFQHPSGWATTNLFHSLNKNNKKSHNSQIFLSNANVESNHSQTPRQ